MIDFGKFSQGISSGGISLQGFGLVTRAVFVSSGYHIFGHVDFRSSAFSVRSSANRFYALGLLFVTCTDRGCPGNDLDSQRALLRSAAFGQRLLSGMVYRRVADQIDRCRRPVPWHLFDERFSAVSQTPIANQIGRLKNPLSNTPSERFQRFKQRFPSGLQAHKCL